MKKLSLFFLILFFYPLTVKGHCMSLPILRWPLNYLISIKLPLTIISILLIIVFSIYSFYIIKKSLSLKLSAWQLTKKTIKRSLAWSYSYSLLLTSSFILFKTRDISYFNILNILFLFSTILPVFALLNLISIIEIFFLNKDRRKSLISCLHLILFSTLTTLIFLLSSYYLFDIRETFCFEYVPLEL